MARSTTYFELLKKDLEESGRRLRNYHRSSSLPHIEKWLQKPKVCHYRRDKVMMKIMKLEAVKCVNQYFRKG